MADSPFCPNCLSSGELRHTYKVAGQRVYKCATCKWSFAHETFKDIDFAWRTNFDGWNNALNERFKQKVPKKVVDEIDRVKKIAKHE